MQCNQVSYQSILKHFHFFYLKVSSLLVHNSQFPSCVNFIIFLWVVVPTHTYTHQNHFSHFKVMSVIPVGFSSRKFSSDTSGGWFTRLLIERGPMPRCTTNISHLLNRLKITFYQQSFIGTICRLLVTERSRRTLPAANLLDS